MGIGPLVAWRRASLRALGKTFPHPDDRCARDGNDIDRARLRIVDSGSPPRTRFGAFVAASIALEFVRGEPPRARAFHALSGGSWLGALVELVGRNRRRYGGYIVHASILMLAIGIAGSSAYQTCA